MLKVMWMIMTILGYRPSEQIRFGPCKPRSSTIAVLSRIRPWVEVEIVMQLAVRATKSEDAKVARKRAMIDPGRSPEISTGRQMTKLHHERVTPDVVTLLGAIMVRDIVLPETRCHAIQEGQGLGQRIVLQNL